MRTHFLYEIVYQQQHKDGDLKYYLSDSSKKCMINYPCILDKMSQQIPLSLTKFKNSINEYSYILDLISKLYE